MIALGQMIAGHWVRLKRSKSGVAAIEFAIIAPVFLMTTMGIFDIAYQFYARSVLEGVVEKAGRDATLEGFASSQVALDNFVTGQVRQVWSDAALNFDRKAYAGFADVGEAERYTDANTNGVFDAGECFEDSNANTTWDSNRSINGNGGADQVIVYTVTMNVQRVFPLWRMLGQPQSKDIIATTTLRNQPYGAAIGAGGMVC